MEKALAERPELGAVVPFQFPRPGITPFHFVQEKSRHDSVYSVTKYQLFPPWINRLGREKEDSAL